MSAFIARLRAEQPPLARIDSVAERELAHGGETGFRIVASEVLGRVSTGIPADAATCPDCLRELLDPSDRRYRYPFLNCTNCGPRFTITRRIPYDRPQTSMAKFPMCPECQREYDDPLNRRFHAQPNACSACGPRVWLVGADGAEIPADDRRGGLHRSVGCGTDHGHQRHRRISPERGCNQRDSRDAPARAQAPLWKAAGGDGARSGCGAGEYALSIPKKKRCSPPQLGPSCWRNGARAAGLRRALRRGFRGSASICRTHRCNIFSSPILASAR